MFTRPVLFEQRSHSKSILRAAMLAAATLGVVSVTRGQEASPPVILQDFESTWQTITNRMPDIFAAGYGGVYTPPPGRAESGNQSVGYDVYDRFDLGSAGNPTLYGTATGLKTMVNAIHAMGGSSYIDLVWNQSGFADASTTGFAAAGGYPGFALTLQNSNSSAPGYNTQGYNAVDGDYHSAYASGDQQERLAGLVDIAQESNNVFIRQPTAAGSDNIPGPTPGASPWFYTGLANVPNPSNAQFYPSTSGSSQTFYDPTLNQTFTRYNFNNANPMSGTPTAENAMGYLQRYAQYMVQVYGADGFRVDAAKNMPEWVMNYLDLATYDSSNRYFLNGQQENVFSFSEVYDSSGSLLTSYVNKSIYSSGNNVGGNRDVYDFPLFFAMQSNLTGTTSNNNWYNVVSASIDCYDSSNGTQDLTPSGNTGVKFVSSQDNGAPSLDSVAYAYTLMMPGNAMVYYNGHNFGTEAQRNFPQEGREDALGGAYGTALTTLVDLRNRYGRGNYRQDWLETNNYAFERQGSALVMLSNNTQAGYDSRTIDVTFAPGTPLIEQTGNAHGSTADPHGDIPQLLIVNADSSSPTGASVNARFLHNSTYNLAGNSAYTGDGYLVYGIPTPTGTLSLTNVASTFGGTTPNTSDSNIAYENGTDVVSTIDVIKSANFILQLNTVPANLLGYYRYQNADGDNAILKVDGGIDVNNTNGLFTDPGNTVNYGFEQFTTTHNPGFYNSSGYGLYNQSISSTQLGQGYHYITVEGFTHRTDGGPAVYTDWKQTVYIDLAPPNSAPSSFGSTSYQNWTLGVTSVDGLANNIHTFLDLPAGLSQTQILALVSSSNQATQEDTNLWQSSFTNLASGNHAVTIVTYKPDGTYNIQRFSENQQSFLGITNGSGGGIGDLNGDGTITATDINLLVSVVQSNNGQFNPAADVNGDGLIDLADTFLLGPVLSAHNVAAATRTAYNNFVNGVGNTWVATHTYTVIGTNVIYQDTAGQTNVSGGAILNASYVRGTGLSIAAGGLVQIQSNTTFGNGTSKVSSLSMAGSAGAWTGTLDLTNNSIVVESTTANAAADLARLTSMVQQGYATAAWTGQGITSSTAATDTTHLHALGIILNKTSTGTALYPSFNGQTADANAILIRYTYYGDANLDGTVDGSDYSRIDNGYLMHLTGWANGDFNYDGVINGSDYTLIDNAFNMQGPSGGNPSGTALIAKPTAQIAGGTVSVPEPAGLAIVALGLTGLLGRTGVGRRRNWKVTT